jgi:two-component system phosphate regulon sensor histidine kinase PhoR
MEERVQQALVGEPSPAHPDIVELEAVRKDTTIVPIEIRDNILSDPQGRPAGVLVMARDISARKALERQRAEFLAMLTHDIKNPLTSLMGYTDYLLEDTGKRDATKRDEVLPWIKSNAFTILSLVNNYLDLSRIEDKQLNLHKEPAGVNDLLQRIGRQYAGEARHRQITLELQLQKKPLWVEGDHLALERIFANLVYNALKFTPKQGQVTISSASRHGEAVVTVADTGLGIPAEEIPILFGKYQRAAAARRKDGTGLGLFIVKTLLAAHGGRIEVESQPGSGTCFRVFLPLKAA